MEIIDSMTYDTEGFQGPHKFKAGSSIAHVSATTSAVGKIPVTSFWSFPTTLKATD